MRARACARARARAWGCVRVCARVHALKSSASEISVTSASLNVYLHHIAQRSVVRSHAIHPHSRCHAVHGRTVSNRLLAGRRTVHRGHDFPSTAPNGWPKPMPCGAAVTRCAEWVGSATISCLRTTSRERSSGHSLRPTIPFPDAFQRKIALASASAWAWLGEARRGTGDGGTGCCTECHRSRMNERVGPAVPRWFRIANSSYLQQPLDCTAEPRRTTSAHTSQHVQGCLLTVAWPLRSGKRQACMDAARWRFARLGAHAPAGLVACQ